MTINPSSGKLPRTTLVNFWRGLAFGWRLAILIIPSALINLALNSPELTTWLQNGLTTRLPGLSAGQLAYFAFILRNLLIGVSLILLVLVIVWLEQPGSFRQFFKLGPIDWWGLGLIILLVGILDWLESTFLRSAFYEPVRQFFVSLGLPGRPDSELGFVPDPSFAGLNVFLLLLISWVEAPEEIIFRGYVQNHLQERIGPTAALLAGALIWNAWHLLALAELVRRLPLALVFSLVFRLRQNTTPLAVWHPLGNRLLLLAYLIGSSGTSRV